MMIPHHPFYFVRHGETDWNKMGKIMGHQDIPLNQRGIEQSNILKNKMQEIKFGKIWSSPLARAQQTAEIINDGTKQIISLNNNLMERCWGVGEGEVYLGLGPDMNMTEEVDKVEHTLPFGAESYINFKERIIRAFQEILEPQILPPLIVSHGGVFLLLAKSLAHTNTTASNCEIYYFNPPYPNGASWALQNLTK